MRGIRSGTCGRRSITLHVRDGSSQTDDSVRKPTANRRGSVKHVARLPDPYDLSELAFTRFNHYKATRDVNSLVEAVQIYRQCVGLTAPFDDDLPTRQFFLLISLRALYDETRQPDLLREAIASGTAAARTMSPQRVGYATGALNLAVALRDYASLVHDVTSVDQAVAFGRWAANTLAADDPLRPDALKDLAAALSVRFSLTGDPAAAHEAVTVGRWMLGAIPVGHELRAAAFYDVSGYLEDAYTLSSDRAALDEAVTVARWGVQVAAGDRHAADHFRRQANLLRRVAEDFDDPAALREAVGLLRSAVTLPPPDRRSDVATYLSLSSVLRLLHERTDELPLLVEAVARLRDAVERARDDIDLLTVVAENQMKALRTLAQATADAAVLREAIGWGRWLVETTPPTAEPAADRAGLLAVTLVDLDETTNTQEHIDESIALLRRAVEGTTGVALRLYRYALWRTLRLRYNARGGVAYLAEAIEQIRALLEACGPGDEMFDEFQFSLGSSLAALFNENGRAASLEESSALVRRAVAAAPRESDKYYQRRAILAVVLLDMARRNRDDGMLGEALAIGRENVERRGKWVDFSNLAATLMRCYEDIGTVRYLEEAVAAGRRAIELEPDDPTALSNLATTLQELFERSGDNAALDETIVLLRRAAAAVREGHPNAVTVLSNIAVAMNELAGRSGDPGVAGEALQAFRAALASSSVDHAHRGLVLNNFGDALIEQFRRTGQMRYLEEAFDVLHAAVGSIEDALRGAALSNLARATGLKGEVGDDSATLFEATELFRQALSMTNAPPLRAQIATHLGDLLAGLCRQGHETLRSDALAAYAVAIETADAWPHARLAAARERASLLCDVADWESALPDYAKAVALVPLVVSRHLVRGDRQIRLTRLAGLASDAASCALNAGNPRLAIELLEHGRGVILSQTLDTESDLTELRDQTPRLATRFESLCSQMDQRQGAAVIKLAVASSSDENAVSVPSEWRHQLGREFDDLLAEIRALPGFAAFLQPPRFETLAGAATGRPLVIVNVSRHRCDALLVVHGDVRVVPLAQVTKTGIEERALGLLSGEDAQPELLDWLWTTIVDPVLTALDLRAAVPEAPEERIWWCPTGLLAYLPLHAAERQLAGSGVGRSALELVVSSYAPTVRSLGGEWQAADKVTGAQRRAVVVAMPRTPGASDLPGAAAESEIISSRLADTTALIGDEAQHGPVVAALLERSIAHFACHSVADLDDPSSSRLLLVDHESAPLTLSEIARLRVPGAELAFLSACSTAQTAPQLADEAIHISSAFRLAGYQQVVGTLWPVSDRISPRIVEDFYRAYLVAGGRGAGSAAWALNEATRAARAQHPDQPQLWAAHIHVGR